LQFELTIEKKEILIEENRSITFSKENILKKEIHIEENRIITLLKENIKKKTDLRRKKS
jgi:hypothetical protein